jgi:hypothetical protein
MFFRFDCLLPCLAPGSISGRGYIGEEMESGNQIMVVFNAWFKGRPIPPMIWSRHGTVPVLFDIPFLKLGKLFLTQDYIHVLAADSPDRRNDGTWFFFGCGNLHRRRCPH